MELLKHMYTDGVYSDYTVYIKQDDDNVSEFKTHALLLTLNSEMFKILIEWPKQEPCIIDTRESRVTTRAFKMILESWYGLPVQCDRMLKPIMRKEIKRAAKFIRCEIPKVDYVSEYKYILIYFDYSCDYDDDYMTIKTLDKYEKIIDKDSTTYSTFIERLSDMTGMKTTFEQIKGSHDCIRSVVICIGDDKKTVPVNRPTDITEFVLDNMALTHCKNIK
jgi:hypothetical protein